MLHSKFWQAFFALAPILLALVMVFGYLIWIFSFIGRIPEFENSDSPPPFLFESMGIIMLLVFLIVLISLGSLIFYIVHAVQNPNLKQNNMLLIWILLFLFVGGIGQLVYWIVEIVAKRKQSLTT